MASRRLQSEQTSQKGDALAELLLSTLRLALDALLCVELRMDLSMGAAGTLVVHVDQFSDFL